MGTQRYVLRQMRANLPVVLVLALVVGLGAAAAAATPRWLSSTIDSAAVEAIETGDADLTFRRRFEATTDEMDKIAQQVVAEEPALGLVYPSARWTVSTDEGAVGDSTTHFLNVRMPAELNEVASVTDGSMPSPDVGRIEPTQREMAEYAPVPTPIVEAIVSADIASEFGLEIGGDYHIQGSLSHGGRPEPLVIRVTGVFEPADPDWAGWAEHGDALSPRTEISSLGDKFFHGSVLAAPEVMDNLATDADGQPITITDWLFAEIIRPAAPVAGLASDLPEIAEATRRVESNIPGWSTALDDEIGTFEGQLVAAKRASALSAVSVAALWVILLVLATRLLAQRRLRSVALARNRGMRMTTVWKSLTLEAALVTVPATVVGVAAGISLTAGADSTAGYALAAGVAGSAVVALPAFGVTAERQGAAGRRGTKTRALRRSAAEGAVIFVAAILLWLVSSRTATGVSVDPIVSLMPVVVAVAIGLVVLRVLPVALGIVDRAVRRRRAATAFLVTHWAKRNRAAATLPSIALLLAIGLAALTAAVDAGADRSREVASWTNMPADVVVTSSDGSLDSAIADEYGATAAVAAYPVPSMVTRSKSTSVSPAVVAIDIEAWRRVVGDSPITHEPVAKLSSSSGDLPPAVVAGSLGHNTSLAVGDEIAIGDAPVEIVAMVDGFRGLTESPTIVVPTEAVPGQFDPSGASALFMAGDLTVDDVNNLAEELPDAVVSSRAEIMAAIDSAPLLAAARDINRAMLIAAIVLATVAGALSLLMTAPSREFSLSVLHTLGFSRHQALALLTAEIMPSAGLATVAGVAVGSAVTTISSDALDLSSLTMTLGVTTTPVLDITTTATISLGILTAVATGVVAAIALRPSRLGSALRIGE